LPDSLTVNDGFGLEDGENSRKAKDGPVRKGIESLREQELLLLLIGRKVAEGKITHEHARELQVIPHQVYSRHGILRPPRDQEAVHSVTTSEREAAACREASELMRTRLLDLYPELETEVRALSPERGRQ
jgi:hypothetical protein